MRDTSEQSIVAVSMPAPVILVRDGARYTCFGDGLCCTDAHALGPVTEPERRRLELVQDKPVVHHGSLDIDVVRTVGSRCLFLERSGSCEVHRVHGESAKPATCREFPFGFVATPSGLRVTTQHRCPCRTVGDRELITVDRVLPLAPSHDNADDEIGEFLDTAPNARVSFAEYEVIERQMLKLLEEGSDVLDVLHVAPFPEVDGLTWRDIGHLFRSMLDGTVGGDALATFGDELLRIHGSDTGSRRPRSWADAFVRARPRLAGKESTEAMLNDFVADNLWSLGFADLTRAHARVELGSRAVVARSLARRFAAHGEPDACDMAEAIMVVELAGESSLWRRLVRQFRIA